MTNKKTTLVKSFVRRVVRIMLIIPAVSQALWTGKDLPQGAFGGILYWHPSGGTRARVLR